MTPVKYTRHLANKIAGAREVIIQGATHDVCLEKPDEVNKAIEEFLNSLRARQILKNQALCIRVAGVLSVPIEPFKKAFTGLK